MSLAQPFEAKGRTHSRVSCDLSSDDASLRGYAAYSGFRVDETLVFWMKGMPNPSRDRKGATALPLADARGSVLRDACECKLL